MGKLVYAFLMFLFVCTPIAVAEIVNPGLWEKFTANAPAFLVDITPFLLAIMILCRALAEMLLVLKDKIPGDWDNKAIEWLKKIAEILAKILGQVGIGMPQKIIDEKAKKIQDGK